MGERWVKRLHLQCHKIWLVWLCLFSAMVRWNIHENVAEKSRKYVLLGDNLASHFNLKVIKIAEQNVYFAMLPPNATHLLQPLNVCVFSSMKESWRKILQEWKREVRTKGSFNKQFFPSLLKRLVNLQLGSMKHNLESGFWTTGIFLLNHQEPLSRLPSPILDVSESNVSMNKTLIQSRLTAVCYGNVV